MSNVETGADDLIFVGLARPQLWHDFTSLIFTTVTWNLLETWLRLETCTCVSYSHLRCEPEEMMLQQPQQTPPSHQWGGATRLVYLQNSIVRWGQVTSHCAPPSLAPSYSRESLYIHIDDLLDASFKPSILSAQDVDIFTLKTLFLFFLKVALDCRVLSF